MRSDLTDDLSAVHLNKRMFSLGSQKKRESDIAMINHYCMIHLHTSTPQQVTSTRLEGCNAHKGSVVVPVVFLLA